jgi:hypothetical protein
MLNQNKSDKQFLKPDPDEMSANDFIHEFNNLFTAIISNLSIARMDSSPESDLDNTLLDEAYGRFCSVHMAWGRRV